MQSKRYGAAAAALTAALVAFAPAAWAQSADSIFSRHVREADGTTGQDTNTGAGIKTNHLQNGAVTGAKLAPAAVGTAAIADGAVTAGKLSPGAVESSAIAPGAVGGAAIADGAVTPAKLAAPIPATLVDRAGLDADSLDGYQAGDFSPIMHNHVLSELQGGDQLRRKHTRVIVVANDGTGDFGYLGDGLAAANSLPEPSVVKVMPGEYAVYHPIAMQPHVVLEGSGKGVTVLNLVGVGGGTPGTVRRLTMNVAAPMPAFSVVETSGPLRFEDVELVVTPQVGGNLFWLFAGTSLELDRVQLTMTTAGSSGVLQADAGSQVAIRNSRIDVTNTSLDAVGASFRTGSTGEIVDTTINATGRGMALGAQNEGSLRIVRSRLTARSTGTGAQSVIAVAGSGGTTTIDHSELGVYGGGAGSYRSAFQVNFGTLSAAYSKIDGGIAIPNMVEEGVRRCIGLYDADYAPVTCP